MRSPSAYPSTVERELDINFWVSWFSGTSSIDHRKSQAAKGECSGLSPSVQLQKNNASSDGLTDKLKPPHGIGEIPEKATVSSERPKGEFRVVYASLAELLQWCIPNLY